MRSSSSQQHTFTQTNRSANTAHVDTHKLELCPYYATQRPCDPFCQRSHDPRLLIEVLSAKAAAMSPNGIDLPDVNSKLNQAAELMQVAITLGNSIDTQPRKSVQHAGHSLTEAHIQYGVSFYQRGEHIDHEKTAAPSRTYDPDEHALADACVSSSTQTAAAPIRTYDSDEQALADAYESFIPSFQ